MRFVILLAILLLAPAGSPSAEYLPSVERVVSCPGTESRPFPLIFSKFLKSSYEVASYILDVNERLHDLAVADDGSMLAAGLLSSGDGSSFTRLWLVALDRNGAIREKVLKLNGQRDGILYIAALPNKRFALMFGSGRNEAPRQFAEVGLDLNPVWRDLDLPLDFLITETETLPSGFTLKGKVAPLSNTRFAASFGHAGNRVSLRITPDTALDLHVLADGDRLFAEVVYPYWNNDIDFRMTIGRSGAKPWARTFDCEDCRLGRIRVRDTGLEGAISTPADHLHPKPWDLRLIEARPDGGISLLGIRLPLLPATTRGGRPVTISIDTVADRHRAFRQRLIVTRYVFDDMSGHLLHQEHFLVTPAAAQECRFLPTWALPSNAIGFISEAAFAPDGSVVMFGWAFSRAHPGKDRLVWIGRVPG